MSEYLYIYDDEECSLPVEYHLSHNLCVRFHDDLASLLIDNDVVKKHNYTVKFENEQDVIPEGQNDILKWLFDRGYHKEVDEIVSRNLLFALLADMSHFIFQALMSSKKMKLTVAFHLLRKPFLENLLIIEQLLVNEQTFLRNFELDPSKFDPGKLSNNEKKEIIKKAIEQVHKNFTLDPDLIFDLRFDKNHVNSLYRNSNLATHLVTNRYSSFTTESQNLNFIFSGFNEWDSQLDYIYFFLPYLLMYTTEVVDQFCFKKKLITKRTFETRKFYRLMRMLLQQQQYNVEAKANKSAIDKVLKAFKVNCKNCKKQNSIFKSDLYSFVHHDYLLCKYCLADLKYETNSFKDLISKVMK